MSTRAPPALSEQVGIIAIRPRIEALDVARGMSIFLVVLFHSSIMLDEIGALAPGLWIASDLFASIRMPLFFCISGLLGARAIQASWSALLSGRVTTLLYLYVVWTSVSMLVDGLRGTPISWAKASAAIIWPNPVLWFIWALAIHFIVARAFRAKQRSYALVGASCVTIVITSYPHLISTAEHAKALIYAVFFLCGAYLGSTIMRILAAWKVASALSVSAYVVVFLLDRWGGTFFAGQALLPCVGLVAGLTGACLLSKIPALRTVLSYLGRSTLPIYLAHTQVLKLFKFVGTSANGWPGFAFWGVGMVSILAILLSLVLHQFLQRLGAGWLYAPPRGLALRWHTRVRAFAAGMTGWRMSRKNRANRQREPL